MRQPRFLHIEPVVALFITQPEKTGFERRVGKIVRRVQEVLQSEAPLDLVSGAVLQGNQARAEAQAVVSFADGRRPRRPGGEDGPLFQGGEGVEQRGAAVLQLGAAYKPGLVPPVQVVGRGLVNRRFADRVRCLEFFKLGRLSAAGQAEYGGLLAFG